MRRTPNRPDPRAGFTLVELLVVITILAILFALTAAAVVKALGKGDEAKVRNEVSQLANAVQAFKTDFSVPYLADRLVLPPGLPNEPGADAESYQYLTTVWPRIDPRTLSRATTSFILNGVPNTSYSYWGVPGTTPATLQGHQTLVFFLGGVKQPTGNGYTSIGFSNSATDPMNATTAGRKGPYFEFPADRLFVVTAPLPSFRDIFGTQPYLYFSSRKAGNDYNLPAGNPPVFPRPFVTYVEYANASAATAKWPVQSVRFANPSGFQIISAGKDGTFGSQHGWDAWPGAAIKVLPASMSTGSTSIDGYDDVANFHPTLLGIANN
jgi:prepilin-type N-terminal cleavage/methylation domain-containing protein